MGEGSATDDDEVLRVVVCARQREDASIACLSWATRLLISFKRCQENRTNDTDCTTFSSGLLSISL